jgi:diguanylate cyclase (GGDEF)-like protein
MNDKKSTSDTTTKVGSSFGHVMDTVLYVLSTYFVPLAIGVFCAMALAYWPSQLKTDSPEILQIRVVSHSAEISQPDQALMASIGQSPSLFVDTDLSVNPFWISFPIDPKSTEQPHVVEFPSRHTTRIECWGGKPLRTLGSGSRYHTHGTISEIKSGFSLPIDPTLIGSTIVCKAASSGPARLTAMLWNSDDLQVSARQFQRKSGLLDGGVLVLATFILITAYINRKSLYLLFAAWLIINLRMGALSGGWDTQWLGSGIPENTLMVTRAVTLALYYILTLTLFTTLFRDDLKKVGYRSILFVTRFSCLPLLAFSILLPYGYFLPVIWAASGVGIALLAFLLVRILTLTRSRVALLYSASIAVSLLASLYEVIAASLGMHAFLGSINSVTAALSASLLTALAISEQMRLEHNERLAAQAELEHTYDAMPIGLFTLDVKGRFLSANPALVQMLGPLVLTDGGSTWSRHFSPNDWIRLHQMISGQDQDEMEINGWKIPGFIDTKRFLVKATLARGKIEGSLQDVTEKSRATEHLLFLANHDTLTKAYNRRGIDTLVTGAIRELRSGKQSTISAAYLDLDRFKLINDLFGHDAGDEVLRQVCARVSAKLDDGQSFGRVGGDEFVIIFPGVPVAEAEFICNSIVENLSATPYRVGDKAFYVRGSIGLIEVSSQMQFNDVMSSTDRACREAKASNGGSVVVNERNSAAFLKHEAELNLIALLSRPEATDGFHLEMQPIMSLTAPHQSLNFEVLLRMRDPLGNPVRTDLLIHAAENCGRMGMIDRWVLTTTVQWLETHFSEMKHTKFVCVNLSGASLNDEAFLSDVYALFESKPDLVRYLCLEVTESVALHDLANTRRFVDRIRGYGAKVALDDFGAGYTSFSYLKEFSADLLKIDGSFIVNMNQHPANIAIVEAIVSLAKNLGMKVVAEWAEDLGTLKTLSDIGVDYVQGFVIARPQHPDQLLQARSSASFIDDSKVADFVAKLGKFSAQNATSDLFSSSVDGRLH